MCSETFPESHIKPFTRDRRLPMGERTATLAVVKYLTKQEQLVLCIVLGLLLTGWAVKTYRLAHPPATVPVQQVKP